MSNIAKWLISSLSHTYTTMHPSSNTHIYEIFILLLNCYIYIYREKMLKIWDIAYTIINSVALHMNFTSYLFTPEAIIALHGFSNGNSQKKWSLKKKTLIFDHVIITYIEIRESVKHRCSFTTRLLMDFIILKRVKSADWAIYNYQYLS